MSVPPLPSFDPRAALWRSCVEIVDETLSAQEFRVQDQGVRRRYERPDGVAFELEPGVPPVLRAIAVAHTITDGASQTLLYRRLLEMDRHRNDAVWFALDADRVLVVAVLSGAELDEDAVLSLLERILVARTQLPRT